MHKVSPRGSSPIFQGVFDFRFVKFVNQPDSCPSPWGISAPCSWHYPAADYYGTADTCNVHRAASLPLQILRRSQIPILVVLRRLKPLGRYLTPGKSNHALNHSYSTVPDGHFTPPGLCRKTSHTDFFQCSPFRTPVTLTMLHSFHLRVAIGFGSPHHYCPCLFGLGFQVTTSPRFVPCPRCSGATHSGVLARVLPMRFDRPLSRNPPLRH